MFATLRQAVDCVARGRAWDHSIVWKCLGGAKSGDYFRDQKLRFDGGDFTPAERHEGAYQDAAPIPVPADIYPPRATKTRYMRDYSMFEPNGEGIPVDERQKIPLPELLQKYHSDVLSLDNGGNLMDVLKETRQFENKPHSAQRMLSTHLTTRPSRIIVLILLVLGAGVAKSDVIKDIEYARPDNHSLLLDLHLPDTPSKTPLPVVIWVHGGGWKNGSKKNCKAAWLVKEGFAVASINFRLTNVAQWPAQIEDCREAVRWIRRNAAAYGLNADRIGAWGSSSGGHLVALMGTLPYPENEPTSSRVAAVCDWYGPTELLTMPPNTVGNGRTEEDVANSNGAKLLGCTVKDCPELAKQASAYDNVSSDDAAFLIMHGDADTGVPVQQSIQFHDRLKDANVFSKLEIIEGAGHGGPPFETPEARAIITEFFERFLTQS